MAGAPPLLLLLTISCVLLAFLHAAGAARLLLAAPGDADALLKLKAGIDDGGSGVLQSWAPGTSPCDGDASNWAGVLCHKGDVLGLQLENMGLSGKLDLRVLAGLRGLRTLSFMDNHFAGPMPDIRDLDGLRAIFLSGNGFSGQIPADAFEGMGSLKKVYLANNSFSGPIPASLAGVPRLLELQLNDNGFQGKIPDLPQKELKVVDVANNDLEGEIPASLKSMNPAMFAGNKKLCGGSLDTKCAAPPTPPAPAKADTVPTPAAPEKGGEASPSPPATPTPAQPAEKPTQNDAEKSSTSAGVLVAFVGLLAIVGFALLALQRRREYNTENFGPAMSKKPSMRKINAEPAKLDTASAHADAPSPETAAAAAAAAAAGGSSRAGAAGRKAGADQGRLTFVREDRGRFFELQDLLKATAEVLGGSGTLGVCYRATLAGGNASIVVKRFKEMNRVGREDFEEHMRRLGRLSHRNLLPLVAYYYRKEEKLLMHDYVPKRSLAHLLHGEGRGVKKAVVHWTARLKIVKGVARALGYMYDELPMLTVPHGHLKSSNVLLDEEFEPLLTDYALVPVMNQSHAAQLMVAFKSPERKQFGKSSKKSDVWCLGLLILEVVTGKPPSYDGTKPAAATAGDSVDNQQPQKQKSSAGSSNANAVDLAGLVASTAEEEWLRTVVDGDMKYDEEEEAEEVVKLIRIGMACCEGNVESRMELKNAVERIEELKGKDHRGGNEDNSFYSSVSGDGVADRDEDFGNVGIH